jgi:sodium transport system ATP-binding protein
MIEAQGLVKKFRDKTRGEVRAVDGVSFRCRPGEIFGLLGANGAGKTTTLRILATILTPSAGTAIVAGYDVTRQSQKVRSSVGFLSTATALYGRLSAREMVEYFGRLHGLDETTLRQRIDAIFERLGMNDFRDRRCDALSTGMKQKVIFSTHVMSEVEKLCDHIGIIHDGRLLAEGTLADLRQRFSKQDLEDIFVEVVEQ